MTQPKQAAKSKAKPAVAPKSKASTSKVAAKAAPKPKATKKKPLIDHDENADDSPIDVDDEDDDAPAKAAPTGAAGPAKKKTATEMYQKVRAHD